MGSYTGPSLIQINEKGICDNTVLTDSILIGPTKASIWSMVINTSPAFNGNVVFEILNSSDSWIIWDGCSGANKSRHIGSMNISIDDITPQFPYPSTLRIRVSSACTLGIATCYLISIPGPDNPLF